MIALMDGGGYVYGQFLYAQIPRFLGGGKPASVTLLLQDGIDPAALLLSVDSAAQPNRTGRILLLAELADGLLTLNPATGQVIAVRSDVIAGVADGTVATWAVETTPAPESTATPGP